MGNPFYPAYDPDRGRWSDDRLALTEPMVLGAGSMALGQYEASAIRSILAAL